MTTWRFARVLAAMWWVFVSVGVLIPLLPQYVRAGLGGSAGAVGGTVLLYAVSGILARPIAGVYLRRRDPWPLMAASVLVAVTALLLTPLVHLMAWMLTLRFVDGFVLGCFYLAAATTVVQGTPRASRGKALSYFSVPLFLGTAVGPVVGDALIASLGSDRTWLAAGGLLALAVPACVWPGSRRDERAAGRSVPPPPTSRAGTVAGPRAGMEGPRGEVPPATARDVVRTLLHPAAIWPAAVLAVMVAGWAAFQAFVPLYGPQLGMSGTGPLFLLYSVVVLAIRIGGASLFDRLPMVELVVLGAVANVAGLLVAWWWAAPAALFVAAALMAVTIGLSYTTLMRIALEGVPPYEESAVLGAYSISYDLGVGLGAAVLGALVTTTGSYSAAFLGGAVAGTAGLLLLLACFWSRRHAYTASALAAASDDPATAPPAVSRTNRSEES
jgi:predicted MFS family arabinose efflux permease